MRIVIGIPEDAYNYIKANGARIPYYKLTDAIKNGTPLPKGHGRLIDADEIIKIITDVDGYERFENSNLFAKHYYDVVKEAPTIIEADKAESEVEE